VPAYIRSRYDHSEHKTTLHTIACFIKRQDVLFTIDQLSNLLEWQSKVIPVFNSGLPNSDIAEAAELLTGKSLCLLWKCNLPHQS
jgi:hypothetical protein